MREHHLFYCLALSVFALAGCQAKRSGTSSTTAAAPSSEVIAQPSAGGGGTQGDPTTIAALPTSLGARNFDQINGTMESLTGVAGNSSVINRFNSLKAQLPSDNDIKSLSFSGQGAITVLAAEYCSALILNPGNMYASQLAGAIGGFNLNAPPSVAFAGNGPSMLAQSMILKFWGSGYASNPNAATAQQGVMKLLADLSSGQADTATTTKNAVIGACTSVLASAPVSIY